MYLFGGNTLEIAFPTVDFSFGAAILYTFS